MGSGVVQPSLRFTLSFVDGCGVLQLEDRLLEPGGRAERVALEIPGLRFPFDLSGGLLHFQNRRCRLRELCLSFTSSELGRLIPSEKLANVGLFDPVLELVPEGLRFAARVTVSGRQSHFTARARVRLLGSNRLSLHFHDLRVHGFLPVPAPMLLHALFVALGAQSGPGGEGPASVRSPKGAPWASSLLRTVGVTVLELSVLELSLFSLLAAHGWRLPERREARLDALELGADRLQLRFSNQGDRTDATIPGQSPESHFPDAEAALAAGDVGFALCAYRQAHLETPDDPFVRDRLLQLLASSLDWLPELAEVMDSAKRDIAEAPIGLLTSALLASQAGQPAGAAGHYLRLADLAAAAGENLEEACARLAAAEQYEAAGEAQAATAELERAIARRPEHRSLLRALRQRFSAEERWEELLHLLGRHAAVEEDPAVRASLLSACGLILLERLGKEVPARDRFEQARHLHGEDPGVWEGLGRLKAREGDRTAALAALERAGQGYLRANRPDGQARALVAIGALEETTGSAVAALERFRQAAELDLGGVEPLHLAADLLSRLGRHPEAADRLEEALGRTTEPRGRVRVLRRLAALEHDGRRDPGAARRRLEEALQARPSDVGALEDLARLLESQGETRALEPLLRRAVGVAVPGEERRGIARLCQTRARELGSESLLAEGLALMAEEGGRQGALQAIELADLAESAGNGPLLRRAGDAMERILASEDSAVDPLPVTSLANRLSALRLRQGDRTGAEKLAQRVLASYPDAAAATQAWQTIVRCALERGDIQAMRASLAGWAEDPRVADTPAARAARLAEAAELERDRLGAAAGAAPLFERALELDPHSSAALLGLAGAAEERGDWPLLEELLRRLLTLPSPSRSLRHRLAEVLMRRAGGMEEAERIYEGLLDQDREDALAALGLGRCGWQAGHLEASVAQFERVVAAVQGQAGAEGGSELAWAAEAHLRLAQSARLLGVMAQANRHLQLAQQSEPAHGAPLDVLVEVLEAFGRIDDLITCLERRRAGGSSSLVARQIGRALGGVLERVGRADDAVAIYRGLLAAEPDDAASLFRLAEIFRREGRREELASALERLLALASERGGRESVTMASDPIDVEATGLELYGLVDEMGGGSDKGESVLRRVLALRPESPEALAALSSCLERQPGRSADAFTTLGLLYRLNLRANLGRDLGRSLADLAGSPGVDAALAMSVLGEAVAADPRDGAVVDALVNRYEQIPDEADRLEGLRALLERVPDLAGGPRIRIHVAMAAAAEERGDWAAAEEELGRVLACDPDPAQRAAQLVVRARVRILRGRIAEGENDLHAALQVLPDHPEALLQLADLAETSQAWETALGLLDRLAEAAGAEDVIPRERLAFRRAMAALRAGDPRRAEAGLEEVLAIDPDQLHARETLVEVQLRRGNLEGARAHLERLTAAYPDRPVFWTALGELYERQALHREAADALGGLARALAEARPRAEALVRRGDLLCERLEDPGAAQHAYRLALEADPTYPSAAVRLIEARWRAGELNAETLADRVVELATGIGNDETALDQALAQLLDRNDRGLAGALREALERRAQGSQDRTLAAVRQRLAADSGGAS